jgi:hypothetical protein
VSVIMTVAEARGRVDISRWWWIDGGGGEANQN